MGGNFKPSGFNDLQQRLNRKKASKDLQNKFPVFIRAYDILFYKGKDLRKFSLLERRKYLEKFQKENTTNQIDLSTIINFSTWEELTKYKNNSYDEILQVENHIRTLENYGEELELIVQALRKQTNNSINKDIYGSWVVDNNNSVELSANSMDKLREQFNKQFKVA